MAIQCVQGGPYIGPTAVSGTGAATLASPVLSGTGSNGGGAPEPGGGSTIMIQDDFNRSTATITSGWITNGAPFTAVAGRSGNAIRCAFTTADDDFVLEHTHTAVSEIYYRYYYRIQSGWLPAPNGGPRGNTGSGMKWFMPQRDGIAPRFTMGVGELVTPNWQFASHDNGSTSEPNPTAGNVATTPRFDTTNDGNWHKYTLHVKVSAPNPGVRIWCDDILVHDTLGLYDHNSTQLQYFDFPGLVVDGVNSGEEGTIDIDDFVCWHN